MLIWTFSRLMVTVAVPDFVLSWMLWASTLTLFGLGTVDGALYSPLVVIVPTVAFPPATPLTNQLTAELKLPVPLTVALNC
jgi:hypothetical protein